MLPLWSRCPQQFISSTSAALEPSELVSGLLLQKGISNKETWWLMTLYELQVIMVHYTSKYTVDAFAPRI